MGKNDIVKVSDLVDMRSTAAVFEEVKYNFVHHYPVAEFRAVRFTFNDFNDLYEGKYAGYRACNTKYHDKIHTTDALLAISRLIDGYNCENPRLPVASVKMALIATILHDAGYIQSKKDRKGTGAKYTLNHVERSIDFMKKYFGERRFGRAEFVLASNMVRCTGLGVDIEKIPFRTPTDRLLGKMLGTADLLGQMASRTYLERLIYLYREFKEGHVKGYDSEYGLLQKTLKFYDATRARMKKELGDVSRYARIHFRERYHIDKDLYQIAIERQIEYLNNILKSEEESYRDRLRRQV